MKAVKRTGILLAIALATPAAIAQRGHGGGPGGPPPALGGFHGAPPMAVPHMPAPMPAAHIPAPVPHFAAPAHMPSAPHFAAPPHMAAPIPHFAAPMAHFPAPHYAAPHFAVPHPGVPNFAHAPVHFAAPRIAHSFPAPRIAHGSSAATRAARNFAAPHVAHNISPAHMTHGFALEHIAHTGNAQRHIAHNFSPSHMGQNVHGMHVVQHDSGPHMAHNVGGPHMAHNVGGPHMAHNAGGPDMAHNAGGPHMAHNVGGPHMAHNAGGPHMAHNPGGPHMAHAAARTISNPLDRAGETHQQATLHNNERRIMPGGSAHDRAGNKELLSRSELRSGERRTHEGHQVIPHLPFGPLPFASGFRGHLGRRPLANERTIPGPASFANPRHVGAVRAGRNAPIMAHLPAALPWRSGAPIPRAGKLGRAGIIDPGGYIRSGVASTSVITPDYVNRRWASRAFWQNEHRANAALINSNIPSWPNQWMPVPGWQTLGGLWNTTGLGYYNGYSWNGINYPVDYFAPATYMPTPYVFDVASGAFWQPGLGYMDYLPADYQEPITVRVQDVVPMYDFWGNIIGYRTETFYYDAFWDPNAQAYGYYDYRGAFHWVTFPWLNTWMGESFP